jgi:outer membrane protein
VGQASLDAYQEQLRTATLLWKQGVGQRIDVYRATSQVADAERELLRQQNDLREARSALNDLIGKALDTDVPLAEALANSEDELSLANRAELIQTALSRRSEILGADLSIAAAKKGIKLARADEEPQVYLGLSGNYYPTTSFENPRHSNAGLMVSVSFPVLDGGLSRNQVNEAKAQVDNAKAQEDQIKRNVAIQVQNASLDAETARKRLDAANTSLQEAQEARKLAQQRFAAQVAQYLEVTDAQAALTAAQAAQVNATYDLITAQARLARVSGAWDSNEPINAKTNNLTQPSEKRS